MEREFALAPPGRAALLGLCLPLLAAIGVIAGTALLDADKAPRELLFALPLVLAVGGGLFWALGRRRIVVRHRELEVTAAAYRKKVALDALDLERARIVDLAEHTELRPMLKTNGFSLPGFAAGHYRLRNRGKAFCLLTDRSRVLALPVRDGSTLLLSPEKPRELLEHLRELAAAATRG